MGGGNVMVAKTPQSHIVVPAAFREYVVSARWGPVRPSSEGTAVTIWRGMRRIASARSEVSRIDLWTLVAIAAFVNVAATAIHEALGHGLLAVLLGGHVIHVTSVDLNYDTQSLGDVQQRIVAAAGPLANIMTGLLVVSLAERIPVTSPVGRYASWLFGHVSLFVGGGYAMALSFAPFGDMHEIVRGLAAPLAWQIALTLVGVAVSLLTLFQAARALVPFVGEGADRQRRAIQLTLVPYLTMGIVAVTSGALNPDSPMLIVISAGASSFGGNAFIAWLPAWMRRFRGPQSEPLGLPRSPLAIGLGAAALLVDYIALAPGLPR